MEFRPFVSYFIAIPCQVVLAARRIVLRTLVYNSWQTVFFRLLEAT
jgi:hypothetical protein